MKNKILVFSLLLFSLILFGCEFNNTPTKKVESLLMKYQNNSESVSKELDDYVKSEEIDLAYQDKYKEVFLKQYRDLKYEIKDEKIDVTELLNDLVKKYKLQRRDVEWRINVEEENILRGTYDIWKLVFDNIFGNFVVYADKCIEITIKNNTLEFYNDGDNIEDDLINDVFTQYKKGIKGKFGLGLSIVKKSVELYGYKITVENKDKGVLFKIQ